MPSSAHDRARSAKACVGERKAGPETASVQDLEAVRIRVARSSEGMTVMVEGASPGRAGWRGAEAGARSGGGFDVLEDGAVGVAGDEPGPVGGRGRALDDL